MMDVKQVIVIRKDLKMRLGKACSQAAHASMKVLLDLGGVRPVDYGAVDYFEFPLHEEIEQWVSGSFKKIVLGVESEQEMLELLAKASAAGLYTSLITDNGLTEFNGVKTNTVIAIGPNYAEKIDPITGHLKPL